MEPILSKQEITDLLDAIKAGKVSLDLDKEVRDQKIKDYTEVNLFQVNALKDELSRLPNFDIILDNFCQNYSITLTNELQRTFSITRSNMDTGTFLDFLLENKDSGAIGVLDVTPLKHGALVLVDKHLCFNFVEIMLGASTEIDPLNLERNLTNIELNIISTILSKCCDDLSRAFQPLIDLNTSLIKVESNSRLVSITEADAEILIGSFAIKLGEITGEMKVVFPLATLEPLREGLRELLNVNKAKQGLWTDVLQKELSEIYTEIIAQSGTIDLSVNELLSIKEGDILYLDYNPNQPLNILVEDKPKFYAIPGTHSGKKAVNITGVHNQGAK